MFVFFFAFLPGQVGSRLQSTTWAQLPGQAFPLPSGAGSVQVLVWMSLPGPQVTEQAKPSELQSLQPPSPLWRRFLFLKGVAAWSVYLRSHLAWLAQMVVLVASPLHWAPVREGVGLSHLRVWVMSPLSQVAEQVNPSVDQSLQPPFTAFIKEERRNSVVFPFPFFQHPRDA